MKLLIIFTIAFVSFSSFAKECETDVYLSADASHVVLNLTEKDKAEPDGEFVKQIISEREQSDCKSLEKKLEAQNLKIEIEGVETEVKIINLSPEPVVSLLDD